MTVPSFVPISDVERALLEHHPRPVLVLDAHHRVRYVNPAGLRLGPPEDDPLGHVVWDRYPHLRDSGFFREYDAVIRERRVADFEEYRPEADMWFRVTAYPVANGLVAILRDITAEKRTVEALLRARADLDEAQRVAHMGTWSWDLRTNSVTWSDGTYRLLGQVPGEFAPDFERVRANITDPAELQAFEDTIAGALNDDRPFELLTHMDIPGRGRRALFSRAEVQRAEDGTPIRMIGAMRDVTEEREAERVRLRLEARLREAERLESLGVLAGGVAHDFNNLLVGVLGNALVLLEDLPVGSPLRGYVAEIERAATRASHLTRQLLAYAGKGAVILEPLDLGEVVREAVDTSSRAATAHAWGDLAIADALPAVRGDRRQLQQLISALLENAFEASSGDGLVHLQVEATVLSADQLAHCVPDTNAAPGAHVAVRVTDEGAGMDGTVRARMFEPFFSTKFTGRGLGLAACLGIVRAHAGAIHVSTAPGRGTTMTVFLPVDDR